MCGVSLVERLERIAIELYRILRQGAAAGDLGLVISGVRSRLEATQRSD